MANYLHKDETFHPSILKTERKSSKSLTPSKMCPPLEEESIDLGKC